VEKGSIFFFAQRHLCMLRVKKNKEHNDVNLLSIYAMLNEMICLNFQIASLYHAIDTSEFCD
jgi:hypothetical protein